MNKAKKVHKHVKSYGILYFILTVGFFYDINESFLHFERMYVEAIIGFAVFWFGVKYAIGLWAKKSARGVRKRRSKRL